MMKDELERLALLESRVKELWQLLLYFAKEAGVLDSGLADRSMKSLLKDEYSGTGPKCSESATTEF